MSWRPASANPGTEAGDQAAAADAEQASAAEGEVVEGDDTGEHVGGAGARW